MGRHDTINRRLRVHREGVDRQACPFQRKPFFFVENPSSWRTKFIRSPESLPLRIVNDASSAMSRAWHRRSLAPIASGGTNHSERKTTETRCAVSVSLDRGDRARMIWSIISAGERNVALKPDPAMRPEPSCLFPSDEEARVL